MNAEQIRQFSDELQTISASRAVTEADIVQFFETERNLTDAPALDEATAELTAAIIASTVVLAVERFERNERIAIREAKARL